jgi:bifunctional non-homologous end joining protein LigD
MPLSVPPPRGSRFGSPMVLSRVHWVRPEMVVKVSYAECTPDGLLRHVVFTWASGRTSQPATFVAIHPERGAWNAVVQTQTSLLRRPPPSHTNHRVNNGELGDMTEVHRPDRSGHAASEFNGSNNRNDQEDMNRARHAAEALFAPKQPVSEPAIPAPVPASEQPVRKPRILSAVPPQPVQVEPIPPLRKSVSRANGRKIPVAHLARIRTWVKYGMNVPQVAELMESRFKRSNAY